MKKRSNSYWLKRADKRMNSYHKSSDLTINKVNNAYDKAIKDINEDINKIFYKYKLDGNLTDKEARQLLNSKIPKKELNSIRSRIHGIQDEELKKYMMAELNAEAYKARITRLEALKESIYINTKLVADVEIRESTKLYTDNINNAYYSNIFEIQKGIGIGFNVAEMPLGSIQEILKNKWSGKHYSERIWGNTDVLSKKLEEVITAGLMSGKSSRIMAKELEELTNYGKFAAERIIRTETTYITNMADIESYKECGIDKYIFISTLDLRTSKQCREKDNKVFQVKEAEPGINLPPLHPYCRSTTIAYFENRGAMERRARDPETGEAYLIPSDMNYDDWYNKFVVDKYGKDKADTFEKIIKNKPSDRKQLEKFKEVLGKESPKTLKEFQDLKYNKSNEWEDFKRYYSYKINNPLSDKVYYNINKDIKRLIDNGVVSKTIGTAVKPIPAEYENIHKHARKRMNKRNIDEYDAKGYVSDSKVMFKQGSGQKNVYYSDEGSATVVVDEKLLVTVFSKNDYDDGAKAIMEVVKRYGI